jgi:hypothetical protein
MPPVSEALHDYLPESLHHLETLIGLNALLALIKHRGGTVLNVPRVPAPDHWLAGLIGLDSFKKLVGIYAGEPMEIPRCAKLLTLARDISILQDKRQRMADRELALKYGMTGRGITKALRRIEPLELKPWLKAAHQLFSTHAITGP